MKGKKINQDGKKKENQGDVEKKSQKFRRKGVISVSGGLGDMISLLPLFTRFGGFIVVSDLYREFFSLYRMDIIWWEEKKSEFDNIRRISLKIREINPDFVYGTYPNGRRINLLLSLCPGVKIFYDDGNFPMRRFITPLKVVSGARPIKIGFPELKSYRELNAQLLGIDEITRFDFKEVDEFREEAEKFAKSKYVVFHPTAKYKTKRWDFTKFLNIAERVLRMDLKAVFVLGKEDIKESEEIFSRFGRGIKQGRVKVLFGESINKVISYVKRAFFFLGNDSAIGHIAGLSGVKTFVIYGYTRYYHTAPPNAEIIRLDLPCSPCYNFAKGEKSIERECKYGIKCLRDISVEIVWSRIKDMMLSQDSR